MRDPLFWLGLSLLVVTLSAVAVIVAALPAMQEVQRAARSATRLFDTLHRDLPPTLESIRLTGLEITELTDELQTGVTRASRMVKQVDEGLVQATRHAQQVQVGTQSVMAGLVAAWRTLQAPSRSRQRQKRRQRRSRR